MEKRRPKCTGPTLRCVQLQHEMLCGPVDPQSFYILFLVVNCLDKGIHISFQAIAKVVLRLLQSMSRINRQQGIQEVADRC